MPNVRSLYYNFLKPFADADGLLLLHFRGVFKDWILRYGYNSGYVDWYGMLGDLRFYDRVLTIVEIDKLSAF